MTLKEMIEFILGVYSNEENLTKEEIIVALAIDAEKNLDEIDWVNISYKLKDNIRNEFIDEYEENQE